ncbi:hypothetical protein KKB69_02050 [Patescibacteria group bacterium]|nr:hypothetical protein [Patescibacteria group bacterium]
MGLKPKVAIYDFTDCEGCEVEIISLRERFLDLEKQVDIVDWRLGQERKSFDSAQDKYFDIALIEGAPITQDEIDTLKWLRENSQYVIALGACAALAGIPGIMDQEKRAGWYKKIYPSTSSGQVYKPKGIDALPLSAYVKVDFAIHGCPVNAGELERIFEELLAGKKPSYRPYSVCFDCKRAGNECRIINKKICLGPITQGGCQAICISGGSPCYGCFGPREEANVEGLKQALKKFADEEEIKRYFTMFYNKNEK